MSLYERFALTRELSRRAAPWSTIPCGAYERLRRDFSAGLSALKLLCPRSTKRPDVSIGIRLPSLLNRYFHEAQCRNLLN